MEIKKISQMASGMLNDGDIILVEDATGTPKKTEYAMKSIALTDNSGTSSDGLFSMFGNPYFNVFAVLSSNKVLMAQSIEKTASKVTVSFSGCTVEITASAITATEGNVSSVVIAGFMAEDDIVIPEPTPQDKLDAPSVAVNRISETQGTVVISNARSYPNGSKAHINGAEHDMNLSFTLSITGAETSVSVYVTCSGYIQSDTVTRTIPAYEEELSKLPTPIIGKWSEDEVEGFGKTNTLSLVNGDDYATLYDTAYMIFNKEYVEAFYEIMNGGEIPMDTTDEGDYLLKVSSSFQESIFTENSNLGLYVVGDGTVLPTTMKMKIRNAGYEDSDWGVYTYSWDSGEEPEEPEKLDPPVISQSGNTVTITNPNGVGTIYYRIGASGGFVGYSSPITLTDTVTVYAYVSANGYTNSDTVSEECTYTAPKLQTPTLELSRSGSTVSGTIGNTVSGATYRYKIGSAPSSSSDGTAISGSTFSFANNNAITVYVRGFRSGYTMSDAVSDSVGSYTPPTQKVATPVISQSGNTVTFTCSTSGATIHYSGCGVSGTCSSGESCTITQSGTMTAYATKSGWTTSNDASKSCTYEEPLPTLPDPISEFTVPYGEAYNQYVFSAVASEELNANCNGASLSIVFMNETTNVELYSASANHLNIESSADAKQVVQNILSLSTLAYVANGGHKISEGDVCSVNWTFSLSGYSTNTGSMEATAE